MMNSSSLCLMILLETQGVSLECNGESKVFHATISTISADNLSSNDAAGLSKNLSSGRICRFSSKFTEGEFTMRDSTNYSYHLQAVQENPENARVYGVRSPCCFSEMSYAPSPIVYLFLLDVMHDFLEGIIPAVLRLVLQEFWCYRSKKKQITVAQLNYGINNFPYGNQGRSSRPPPLSEHALRTNGHLVGSASEKSTVFR